MTLAIWQQRQFIQVAGARQFDLEQNAHVSTRSVESTSTRHRRSIAGQKPAATADYNDANVGFSTYVVTSEHRSFIITLVPPTLHYTMVGGVA